MEISQEQFVELIGQLPNDAGLKIDIQDNKITVFSLKSKDLEELSKKDNQFHVICLEQRPGGAQYFRALEEAWFTPNTPLNYDFEYRVFKWQDMLYLIGSLPLVKKHVCYELAEKMNMRLADGVPHCIGGPITGKQVEFAGVPASVFPLSNSNVFTLENGRNSPIYEGKGEEVDLASNRVMKEIEKQARKPDRN